ncbi:MAG: DUF5457 domain-containing protein [Crocinitomicaceae bacterium]
MSDKKTSTPQEIPLHEVVLKIMFEANPERPAELTVSQVHRKLTDPSISESNILDVLRWLVAQKQVERVSGKFYSLDRFEFIEQRIRDAKESGKELNQVTEDNPLHEVIVSLMFEASKGEPTKFTLDDVSWMISDPKVHKSLVGDVLKWLLNQGRVEYLAGKYSLDPIEFQDQEKAVEKAVEKAPPKKKPATKSKPKKKETPQKQAKIVIPTSEEEKAPLEKKKEVQPKKKETPEKKPEIVIPTSKEEKVAPKKEKEVQPKPKESIAEKVPTPEPKKVEKKVEKVVERKVEPPVAPVAAISEPQPVSPRWRMPVLIVSVICVVYTFYLLFVLNATVSMSTNNGYSEQITKELTSAKSTLEAVSEKGSSNEKDIDFLQEKLHSIEELTQNASENNQNGASNDKINSLLTRLIIALLLSLILVSFLLFSTRNKGVSNKS